MPILSTCPCLECGCRDVSQTNCHYIYITLFQWQLQCMRGRREEHLRQSWLHRFEQSRSILKTERGTQPLLPSVLYCALLWLFEDGVWERGRASQHPTGLACGLQLPINNGWLHAYVQGFSQCLLSFCRQHCIPPAMVCSASEEVAEGRAVPVDGFYKSPPHVPGNSCFNCSGLRRRRGSEVSREGTSPKPRMTALCLYFSKHVDAE